LPYFGCFEQFDSSREARNDCFSQNLSRHIDRSASTNAWAIVEEQGDSIATKDGEAAANEGAAGRA
jgi:hypothetical protein